MHGKSRVSLLPIVASTELKHSVREEVGARGQILPLVIKKLVFMDKGENIQRLIEINQEMCYFLAGTTGKKMEEKKRQSQPRQDSGWSSKTHTATYLPAPMRQTEAHLY